MATGDITAIVIRADGFSADVTIENWADKNVASYDEGTLPDSGKMKLTVVSESYVSPPTLSTASRIVSGTLVMRKAYPNEASFDETISGSDLVVRIAFTDCIYDDDKNGGAGTSGTDPVAVITAGYITAGDASETNAHAGLTCTNNSTLDYPKVIGQWDWANTPFFKRVESDFNMAFRARHGFGIASVYLQALGVSSAVDTNSHKTAPTLQVCQNGLYHESYQQSVTLSGYTQAENITLKAIAYPVVGDADSILDTSTNTVAEDRIRGLTEITCTCDKTGALKTYAVVTTTGNDTTGVSSTTLATAEATPYLTIGAALTDNATVIYVRTGSHDIMGTNPSGTTAIDYWREVRPHPSDAASGIDLARGSSNQQYIASKLAYMGFTGGISGTGWLHGGTTFNRILLFEDCEQNVASLPTVGFGYNSDGVWFVNNTGMGVDSYLSFSNSRVAYSFTGCTMDGTFNSNAWYTQVACDISTSTVRIYDKPVANPAPDQNNVFFEFNSIKNVTSTSAHITYAGNLVDLDSWSYIGNVIESKSGGQSVVWFGGDSSQVSVTNIIMSHNTVAGQRCNLFYNDSGSSANIRNNIWCTGNAFRSYNIKSDLYSTANGNRIGNWAMLNGVGYRDNVYDGTESASFTGDYDAVNVSYEVAKDSTFGQMGYVDEQSLDLGGAGNGDYTPDTGSVLTGHTLINPFITYDLNGNPINSEIGAIQIVVAAAADGSTVYGKGGTPSGSPLYGLGGAESGSKIYTP